MTERGDVKPNGARGKWAQFYLLPDLLALAPAGASGKGGVGATHPLFSELVTLASFGNVDKVRATHLSPHTNTSDAFHHYIQIMAIALVVVR